LIRSVRVGRRSIQQTVAHLGELDAKRRIQAGDNTFEASKMNIKKNSPELYMRFLDLILRLGRRAPGPPLPPLTAAFALIKAPTARPVSRRI
jgi:hypothetical protein